MKLRTKLYGHLRLSIFIFRRFIMRIKNPNAKRGAHSKELTVSAQKKMDDALADMLSSKD